MSTHPPGAETPDETTTHVDPSAPENDGAELTPQSSSHDSSLDSAVDVNQTIAGNPHDDSALVGTEQSADGASAAEGSNDDGTSSDRDGTAQYRSSEHSTDDFDAELYEDSSAEADMAELAPHGDESELDMAPPLAETRIGSDLEDDSKPKSALSRVLHSARPRLNKAQILTALLLGLLGFMLVAQLQLSQKDELTGLRQSELINLLDEVTRRTDDLEAEESRLNSLLDELQSGQNTQQIAQEAAEENAEVQGILAGRLPATGPGVEIEIYEGETPLSSQVLFNVLEELRNAGAEAIQVNDIRLVASSYFSEVDGEIAVNGQVLDAPYVWFAIGDPKTIAPALEIPGGAMPSVRSGSGTATVTSLDEVTVSAVVQVREPEFAQPDTGDN